MLFQFPKKRIQDTGWFLTTDNTLIFGTVKLITIAISENECKVYYRFLDDEDMGYTVAEEQVLDTQVIVPNPKYNIGDGVKYKYIDEQSKETILIDVIKKVEIHMYEKNVVEICYIMEHDDDEWVLEDEIVSYGDPELKSELDNVDLNTNYTEYDMCMSRSDI